MRPSATFAFSLLLLTILYACACRASRLPAGPPSGAAAAGSASEDWVDAALQQAAITALGTRDGCVMVMDPQTGRLRAIVNSRFAFEEAIAPGSTIKPFTLLAGLRAGVIQGTSRLLCAGRFRHNEFTTRCSHPRFKPPFDAAQALAYSCNYYFGRLGEALNEQSFSQTLSEFGFGERTGSDDEREAAGALPAGAWQPQYALGEGSVLVTPAQLITGYSALLNGGHLYVPAQGANSTYRVRERATVQIDPGHRAIIIEGMRGAVTYGTASRAGLGSVSDAILGKTGTAAPNDDYHTNGWFVGFLSDGDASSTTPPGKLRLAVLVFLKHAHGADCATRARSIFEAFARDKDGAPRDDVVAPAPPVARRDEAASTGLAGRAYSGDTLVRVHLAREHDSRLMTLDEYIFGVLAAEGSTETELEALKAQAVISRTYALRNRGRHARDGYDYCASTHCQRFMAERDEGARADFYGLLRRALRETAGEVLLDRDGHVADVYFSAACGGMTADIATLWGMPSLPYLRGVRDDYCSSERFRNWTDRIPIGALASALRRDPRSDPGARLVSVRVVKHDYTGRAEEIAVDGERRRVLRGWEFKLIVGRSLGWDKLKSSRFEVEREGDYFIFRGSGFGHGLGLCQMGAHVMAKRGAAYRQILEYYLPGVSIAGQPRAASVATESR